MFKYNTTGIPTIQKRAAGRLDYTFLFGPWLNGDTIASYTVTTEAGIVCDASNATETNITVWVTGGAVGTKKKLTCRITTAGGRVDERVMLFEIV